MNRSKLIIFILPLLTIMLSCNENSTKNNNSYNQYISELIGNWQADTNYQHIKYNDPEGIGIPNDTTNGHIKIIMTIEDKGINKQNDECENLDIAFEVWLDNVFTKYESDFGWVLFKGNSEGIMNLPYALINGRGPFLMEGYFNLEMKTIGISINIDKSNNMYYPKLVDISLTKIK